MSSIRDAVIQNQARIATGKPLVETAPPVGATTPGPGIPPEVQPGLPIRGAYSPNQSLSNDFLRNTDAMRKGANLRSATFPPPAPTSTVQKATSVVTTIIQQVASTLLLKTNNVRNPNQSILNFINGSGITITVDGVGNLVFTSTAASDGLSHGDLIWAVDPAWPHWVDDFYFGGSASAQGGNNSFGEARWDAIKGTGAAFDKVTGLWPHVGQVRFDSGTTAGTNSNIFAPLGATADSGTGGGCFSTGMPLLDYGGWKMDWVFGFPVNRDPTTAAAFNLTQINFYCGLCPLVGVNTTNWWQPNNTEGRPAFFVGLRFDSDAGANGGAGMSITSVAAATGVYTGTITGGGANAYANYYVVMTGFANSANNGTFLVTASSATTLTTNNTSSAAGTTGTATIPSLADTTFKFEVVSNFNLSPNRNNVAGTVFDTGITPKENTYYRFVLSSTTAGAVVMTLTGDDGSSATNTFSSIPTTSVVGNTGGGTFSLVAKNKLIQIAQTGNAKFSNSNIAWSPGSKVKITGATNAFFNSTWTIVDDLILAHWLIYTGDAVTNITESGSPATQTGYPGLMPYFSWGNTVKATPTTQTVGIDYWAFVINPGLSGATPNPALSRYF